MSKVDEEWTKISARWVGGNLYLLLPDDGMVEACDSCGKAAPRRHHYKLVSVNVGQLTVTGAYPCDRFCADSQIDELLSS